MPVFECGYVRMMMCTLLSVYQFSKEHRDCKQLFFWESVFRHVKFLLLIHLLKGVGMGAWECECGDGSMGMLYVIETNFILHCSLGENIIFQGSVFQHNFFLLYNFMITICDFVHNMIPHSC